MAFNKPVKTFKFGPETNPGIKYTDDSITITGENMDSFMCLNSSGIGLAGDVNFQGMSNQIKMGGLMTFQLTPLMMIPSTMTTPFPSVLPNIALIGRIVEVAASAASMMALLG